MPFPGLAKPVVAVVAFWMLYGTAAGQTALVENKGQWHDQVHYRSELPGAYAYLDQQGITFQLYEPTFFDWLHESVQGRGDRPSGKMHAVKFHFEGMDFSGSMEKRRRLPGPQHYFIGNDASRWATDVYGYESVLYREVLPGVDLRYDVGSGPMKYEFIVAPGADPSSISIEVQGADRLALSGGELVVATSVGEFKELAPFAFQRDEAGKILRVECEYRLRKNRLSYHFPRGYNRELPLVIDPELAFSTFIGAVSSNFGFTASYDQEGNLYAGAIVFGTQYPTTPGAYQVEYGNGAIDCAITKFSSDGTTLLYSTFLGGSNNEAPHSIVVSAAGEAYIFGTTGSTNFPTTTGAYQPGFAGGVNVATPVGFSFNSGSDLFVTKLNAAGSALIGSTYVGGSGNDGISINTPFNFNYGDLFRGEIVIDAQGNAYVATVTNSGNFPIVGGYSSNHTPPLSGVVFKLNANLTQMIWSTYSGGNGTESATSIQLAPDGTVYFSGGTFSSNLATPGAFQTVNAGNCDGYVARVSANGSALLACTYMGTSAFDLTYFVQLDTDDNVYVVGQSLGNYPVSAGVYQNANSGQFIHKFNPNLTASLWSTVVGTGNGGIDISPSAFLVSDCGQIYLAGWGASLNTAGGSTTGLPVTPDAIQGTTDGNDFYIMVLAADAQSLVYGTYFGGPQSSEHVDGGTSRFDKNGTVYQAVCAGCGGNSDFPTQAGVWSQSNNSSNCNLGVFKFKLSSVQPIAEIQAPEVVCPGTAVNFINLSIDADNFIWRFGDGNTSTDFAPTHNYALPGTYEVWLVATSTDGCLQPDSTSLIVEVLPPPDLEVTEIAPICPGETAQLQASGADTYLWSPATHLDNAAIANPVFNGPATTTLTVTGTTPCGTSSAQVTVLVGNPDLAVSDNVVICPGQSAQITASGGSSYTWSPPEGLSSATSGSTTASPTQTTTYTVTAEFNDGCQGTGTVTVTVLPPPPVLEGASSYVSCNGVPAQISISGANTYSWSPPTGLGNSNSGTTSAMPSATTTYTITGSNACGSASMEILVLVNSIAIALTADASVCHNLPVAVSASGGVAYNWQPPEHFADPQAASTTLQIRRPTIIQVTGYDEEGCFSTASQLINIYPRPIITAGRDRVISFGDRIQLETNSPYPIHWLASQYLSCTTCNFPYADPPETTTFYATITSPDGCVERDSVNVFVRGNLYVPNAFTPNGDGRNELFKAEGIDIVEFRLEVYDRWGKLVFRADDIEQGWNGGLMGSEYYCPAGLYPYLIVARERHGDLFELKGHVTLLR